MAVEAREAATRAEREASSARAEQKAHEVLCAERWAQLRDGIETFRLDMKANHVDNRTSIARIQWFLTGTLVTTALAVLGMAFQMTLQLFRGIGH